MARTRWAILVASLGGALMLGGCAHGPTDTQLGTGLGAVGGGLLGNAIFGGTAGTIGGAAAGALIGNEVSRQPRYRGY